MESIENSLKTADSVCKSARIINQTELKYFGKCLSTREERRLNYTDKDFQRLLKENFEKEGLGEYFNSVFDFT